MEQVIEETKKSIGALLAEVLETQQISLDQILLEQQQKGSKKSVLDREKETLVKQQEEIYTSILRVETQISGLQKHLQQLSQLAKCPTCLRDITDSDKRWLTLRLTDNEQSLTQKLDEFRTQFIQLQSQTIELDQKIGNLERQLADSNTLVSKIQSQNKYKTLLSQLSERQAKYNEQFEQLKQQVQDFNPYIYENLIQRREHLKHFLDTTKSQITSYQLNQKAEERLTQELSTHYNNLSLYSKEVGDYKLIEDIWSEQGIITYAIGKFIWEIESLTNQILHLLSPHLSLSLAVDHKRLDIIVRSPKATIPYELCSGGERAKVDLALRLALAILVQNTHGRKLQSLFIDEALTAIDVQGRQNFIKVLDFLQPYFRRVIIITHITDVIEIFANRIELSEVV
jgi:DNA repair exonuclease SbcCD ATPase subunit